MRRVAALCALCAFVSLGQQSAARNKLGLANPDKPDRPYLIHGSETRELEQAAATAEEVKNQLRYWLPGPAAAVRTPLAAPEFLFDSKEIDPRGPSPYRFQIVKGRRELLYRKKRKVVARPYFLHLDGIRDRVVRTRVNASLEPGQYDPTPDGRDIVFPFAVF